MGLSFEMMQVGLAELQAKKVTAWSTGSPADIKEMLQLAVDKGVKTWIEERPMKDLSRTVVGECFSTVARCGYAIRASRHCVLKRSDMLDGKARYRYVLVN